MPVLDKGARARPPTGVDGNTCAIPSEKGSGPGIGAAQSSVRQQTATAGWLCSAVPEEILLAAGIAPRRLYGFETRGEESATFLPATFCAVVHGVLEAALNGAFESLALVILVNSCDAMRRLGDVWERSISSPKVYRLDFPFIGGSAAEEYWVGVLRHLKRFLEGMTGRRITDADLWEAIALMNETRLRVLALDRLRALPAAGLSGTAYTQWLVKAFTEEKRCFLAQTSPIPDWGGRGNSPDEGAFRLVVSGCAADTPHLVGLVEKCGARVVADALCTGTRHFHKLVDAIEDPLRALARRYLDRPPCARRVNGETYLDHLRYLVKETQADGVVFSTLKFCDMVRWRLPRVAAVMAQQKIPFLHVERDGTAASWGQMETRIQAFMELIANRRASGQVKRGAHHVLP